MAKILNASDTMILSEIREDLGKAATDPKFSDEMILSNLFYLKAEDTILSKVPQADQRDYVQRDKVIAALRFLLLYYFTETGELIGSERIKSRTILGNRIEFDTSLATGDSSAFYLNCANEILEQLGVTPQSKITPTVTRTSSKSLFG